MASDHIHIPVVVRLREHHGECHQGLPERRPLVLFLRAPRSVERRPRGMMQCLVTKLLLELQSRHPTKAASLKFANESLPTGALAHGDRESLCSLFKNVAAQFPPQATIYCVVDGVFYYEKSEMVCNACLLVQHLINIMKSLRSAGPVVRVLLASPCFSPRIASRLSRQRRISLQAGLVAEGRASREDRARAFQASGSAAVGARGGGR